ncbi:MAG: hypothetical protein ACP5RI_02795 [Candidatus Micrarchaeia archaeon]
MFNEIKNPKIKIENSYYNVEDILKYTEPDLLKDKDFIKILNEQYIFVEESTLEKTKKLFSKIFAIFSLSNESIYDGKYIMLTLGQAYAIYGSKSFKEELMESELFPSVAYYLFEYNSKYIKDKVVAKIKENPKILEIIQLSLNRNQYNEFLNDIKKYI